MHLLSGISEAVSEYAHWQMHVHDLQLSTHSALYLTVFYGDILSFKAMSEFLFSSNCGKSPSSVGKLPCSVQSLWK